MNLEKVEPNESSCSSPQDSSSVGSSCSITPSAVNSTSALTSEQAKTQTNSSSSSRSSRKKTFIKFVKDPQTVAEDLVRKRAKNTDAARRSRLRKVVKMENLEKQVGQLTTENNELKTRLTVLEIEKKSLEEKNLDKDNRIKILECQLAEAHKRIINRS